MFINICIYSYLVLAFIWLLLHILTHVNFLKHKFIIKLYFLRTKYLDPIQINFHFTNNCTNTRMTK